MRRLPHIPFLGTAELHPRRGHLFLFVALLISPGCGEPENGGARSLVSNLAAALGGAPPSTPRLSVSANLVPCRTGIWSRVSFRRAACHSRPIPKLPSKGVSEIAVRAERAIREKADPEAMHAAALIDLLYDSGMGKPVQRSISLLQTASRHSTTPGPILADLSAAYLIRAERARSPRDLLAAADAAEEALEREPKNRAALFNRALALQRFGLVDAAIDGWRAYLDADSASMWAREARQNVLTLQAIPAAPAAPDARGKEGDYAAHAAADPQGAREMGWCRVLGAWGDALLAGDSTGASAHLRGARVLGGVLERRGGDASLADAVRAITARTGSGATGLARAHSEFAEGCALNEDVRFRAAAPRFAAAMESSEGSAPLRAWARLLYGSMLFLGGNAREGEPIFREAVAGTDQVRYPALAGRARLLLAAVLLRGDRYESGLDHARRAADLFGRAGERANEGTALHALSIAYFSLRDQDEGYSHAHRALKVLRPNRSSHRLHNVLSSTAEVAANDGFTRAAARMQDEDVGVAERTRKPTYVAEARLSRARLRATAGDLTGARRDVAAVQHLIRRLTDPPTRGWMIAQQQIVEAAYVRRADRARAASMLDSAAAFFMEVHNPLLALPAILDGATARLALGDVRRGAAGLESALAIIEHRRDSIRMEPRRAAVF